jgi:type II secretory pathway pseudopilin PulG
MSKRKSAFSILEISVVLLIMSILTAVIISSTSLLQTALLNGARNITNSSVVHDISGITLWLDTTSSEAFDDENIEDGDDVENWHDTKNSYLAPYVATQLTPLNRPLFDDDDINKLPGVKYDGSNHFLSIANFKANMHMTLFVVGKFNNANFFIEHSVLADSNEGFCFWGQGSCLIRRSTTNVSLTESSNWFGNDAAIGILRYDGVTLESRLNNGAYNPQAGVLSNINVTDTLFIGSRAGTSRYSSGSFGEIIMYDRDLSDDEVDDILAYLKKKWYIKY